MIIIDKSIAFLQEIEDLLALCSDHQFGQDAAEWGILTGRATLSFDQETDLRLIMGGPGKPETGQHSTLVEAYQRTLQTSSSIVA